MTTSPSRSTSRFSRPSSRRAWARVARNEVWSRYVALNDREVECLTWSARGKTSPEIAAILGLSKRTVDFHIENACRKLNASTRTEAVVKATSGRLINP